MARSVNNKLNVKLQECLKTKEMLTDENNKLKTETIVLKECSSAEEAYELAAFAYGVIYTFMILVYWIHKILHVDLSKSDNAVVALGTISGVGKPVLVTVITWAVLAFLVLSHLRVMIGSMLCNSDKSILRKNVMQLSESEIYLKIMFLLVKLIAIVALLRFYAFSSNYPIVMPFVLLLEAGLIYVFDRVFNKALSTDDKGYPSDDGKYIIRNDRYFLWVSVAWFLIVSIGCIPPDIITCILDFLQNLLTSCGVKTPLLQYWSDAKDVVGWVISILVAILVVGLCVIFLNEFRSSYKPAFEDLITSILKLWKDIRRLLNNCQSEAQDPT